MSESLDKIRMKVDEMNVLDYSGWKLWFTMKIDEVWTKVDENWMNITFFDIVWK